MDAVSAVYREPPIPAAAADVCEALWTVSFESDTVDWLVLPDGCMDIVLVPEEPPLVAGPATRAMQLSYAAGTHAAGLRFLPAAAPALLGLSAIALRDRVVSLADVPAGPDLVPLFGGADRHVRRGHLSEARAAMLAALVRSPRRGRPDPLARRAAELLRHDPNLRTQQLAGMLAISPRQLRRRFESSVGFGTRRFARIMRLQYFMRLSERHRGATLAWLAHAAGYADHSHLVGDCRELAGRTPSALLTNRRTITSQRREH